MNHRPDAAQLLAAVAAFLRDEALPALSGATAFQARVAANALDMVQRELRIGADLNNAEHERLKTVLPGHEGSLPQLQQQLCEAIAQGHIGLHTPGLADHLWATTLAQLAVDQPHYSTYRRHAPPPPSSPS